MSDHLMNDNLWNMANLLTGFSVAQSLAFLYALGKDLSPLLGQVLRVRLTIAFFLRDVWRHLFICRVSKHEAGVYIA